ncbi:GDP-mannose 4,6-dehydratase [Planctomicrobium sp. SH664]|uniref:GDP-mannose 4,6-dehydratase n=1 Tax=Planctomicrobium sp. SH664 TaxID=3448125 RepID=UPI003F5B1B80
MPIALITGITGQDGSYLTELLLEKGYTVHGIVRHSSRTVRPRIDHLTCDPSIYGTRLFLHYAELEDTTVLRRLFLKVLPDEVYHLAGQSHVGLSFEIPESTCRLAAMGTLGLLEIIRDLPKRPRFLNVGSSEIFGNAEEVPQNEQTRISPLTPYGVAKAFTVQMTRVYRNSLNIFACNAICYNHESPRRGESFVTRKVTRGVAAIKCGRQKTLSLGNLDAQRDWGYAKEYVEGLWKVLQHETPEDFVFATGRQTSVREFVDLAFQAAGLHWQDHVVLDPRFLRQVDPTQFVGDSSKARELLGWVPHVGVPELTRMMVEADLELLQQKE